MLVAGVLLTALGLTLSAAGIFLAVAEASRRDGRYAYTQTEQFRFYHLPATDNGATTFYNQDDRWAIPEDVVAGDGRPMEPYYVIMRIPGEDEAEFVLIQPMVPEGRPNMIAWLMRASICAGPWVEVPVGNWKAMRSP